jgi:hypothetical protein
VVQFRKCSAGSIYSHGSRNEEIHVLHFLLDFHLRYAHGRSRHDLERVAVEKIANNRLACLAYLDRSRNIVEHELELAIVGLRTMGGNSSLSLKPMVPSGRLFTNGRGKM